MEKRIRIFFALIIVLLLVGSFPSLVFSVESKTGGTITVGVNTGAKGWDPQISTSIDSLGHYEQVYESLAQYNTKMEIVPALATSWDIPDPLTYIFHIRKGVKFHNGREMTAEDVKYSMERWRDPKVAVVPHQWAAIDTITVVDPYTIHVKMKLPDSGLMAQIAHNKVSAIVPREVIEKHGDLKNIMCGTGPFKVKEYKPDLYTIYEANKDYWDKGHPRVDQVVFKVVKDETARVAGLRTATLDIGWFNMPLSVMDLKKDKQLQVQVSDYSQQLKFYINHKYFPGNNKKLRQAISAALDRQAMIDSILFGYGELSSIIPPSSKPEVLSKEEVAMLPFYKRDLELSKRLMKEAGYPNGFTFDLTTAEQNPLWTPTAQMIQANLRDVGIKVNIVQEDWVVHLDAWRKGTFHASVMSALWYPTPEGYIDTYFHSKSKANSWKYNNPEVDKLLEESRVTLDIKKRVEIWRKLQYIMADDVALILCYVCPGKYEVVRSVLKDYTFLPNHSRIMLKNAWIDK